MWRDIRRRVLVEGASKREICREYGIHFTTLQKILTYPEPPGYRQAKRLKAAFARPDPLVEWQMQRLMSDLARRIKAGEFTAGAR